MQGTTTLNNVIFPLYFITFSCFKYVKSCHFISFHRLRKIAKQKIRLDLYRLPYNIMT